MERSTVQRVLIAIDFSERARHAFYSGIELATKTGAEAWVLHVAEPIRSYDLRKTRYIETAQTIERVEEGIRRRIDELWEQGGVAAVDRRKVHVVVRGGRAPREIVETANAKQVDVIVMGATGSGAHPGVHMGGTAESVIRHAPCSVYCVREPKAAEATSAA